VGQRKFIAVGWARPNGHVMVMAAFERCPDLGAVFAATVGLGPGSDIGGVFPLMEIKATIRARGIP